DAFGALLTPRRHAPRTPQIPGSAKSEQMEPRLGEIRCPPLLLWGREDRITPPEVGLRFLGSLPRAEIRFIANCGHAPMLEQPAVFAEHLAEFLDSLPPVPASVA